MFVPMNEKEKFAVERIKTKLYQSISKDKNIKSDDEISSFKTISIDGKSNSYKNDDIDSHNLESSGAEYNFSDTTILRFLRGRSKYIESVNLN